MALELNPVTLPVEPRAVVSAPPKRSLDAVLWESRWLIAAVTLVVIALGVVFLRTSTPIYTSSMSLAPPDSGGAGSTLNAGKELAASFGVNIPSPDADDQEVALKQFTSYSVAERLAQIRPDLVQALFRNRWSGTEWVIPDDFVTQAMDALSQLVYGRPFIAEAQPTPYDIMGTLVKRVVITRDRDSSIVDVSFDDRDPVFAREFLDAIFNISQSIMRDSRLAEADARMRYVKDALDKVTVAEYRDTLIGLMGNEERTRMMLAAGTDIGIRIIDHAYLPTAPSGPKAFLILLGSAVLGLIAAVAIVALRARRRRRVKPRASLVGA